MDNTTDASARFDSVKNVSDEQPWIDVASEERIKIIYAVAFSFLAMIIICGNLLVFATFKMNKKVRTKENYFLLSLSCADMAVGCVITPLYAFLILQSDINLWIAYIFTSLDVICGVASIMNLVALSGVRAWAVLKPIQQRNHTKKAYCLLAIFFPWGVSLAAVPGFLVHWFGYSDDIIFIVQVSLCYFIPLSIMVMCYIAIATEVRKRTTERDRLLRKNIKVAKTVAIVIGLFLIAWLPFFTSGIVARICQRCYEEAFSDSAVFFFLKFLQYTNSAGNPAVYAARIPQFRYSFKLAVSKVTWICVDKKSEMEHMSLPGNIESTEMSPLST